MTEERSWIGGRLSGPHGLQPIIGGRIGPDTLQEHVEVRCLVDTGADGVYIKPELAAKAGLRTAGIMRVETPVGSYDSTIFEASLWLPATSGEPCRFAIKATVAPTVPGDCDLLLGMGVLRHFHMTFWPNGFFELRR